MDREPVPGRTLGSRDRISDGVTLVGRDRELASLREHLSATLSGRGSLILIGGDAGIGKTALAETLCQDATERGALLLVGRCYDLSETPPFGPWREVFAGLPLDESLPKLPAAVLPADRSGVVLGSQDATLARVREFLAAMAARQPFVLLLDDIQWADPASLAVLRVVARAVATMPVLIIVTYRPADGVDVLPFHTIMPTLVREARPIRLDLAPLEPKAIQSLIAARYALPEVDDQRLTRYLVQRSDGNAFFLGELLRALQEQGGLVETVAGWRIADMRATRVPALITQVIANRLARFDADEQDMLTVAAVIGQEIPVGLWQSIVGMQEEHLLQLIERAVAAQVLVAREDGVTVGFYHALTREVLYEGIVPPRRRALHRTIGVVLTALPVPPVDAVAHHFERASDPRAAEWLIRAGEQAEVAYAYLTAADRYQAAMRLIEAGDATSLDRGRLLLRLAWLRFYENPPHSAYQADDVLRLATDTSDLDLAAGALFSRGHFRVTSGDFRSGLRDIRSGVAALDALPGGVETWRGMLGSVDMAPLDAFHPVGVLTATLAYCGHFAEARDVGERSVTASWASRIGHSVNAICDMQTYLGLGMAYAGLGIPEQSRLAFAAARDALGTTAQHLLTSLVDLYEFTFPIVMFQTDDIVERQRLIAATREAWSKGGGLYSDERLAEFTSVLLSFLEGRWDEVRTLARQGTPPPPIRFFQYATFGDLAYASGDTSAASGLVQEVLPDGPETEPESGPIMTLLAYQRLAAMLALDSNDLPTARRWLEAHDRFLGWSGAVVGRADGRIGWARYCRATNDLPRAIRHAAEACRLAQQPRQPLALLAAHRTLGELLTVDGQFGRAEELLADALTLADACAVPYERALIRLAQAEHFHAITRPEQARQAVAEAEAILIALGARPALARAEALAGRVAVDPAPASRHPAGLTSREVEVLGLVAGGRSNREIADALGVSVHTVHSHLRHIFDKTGCENRAAATAFAVRHNLV
ncbi:MAG TPA: AAA family ATPase [Thermomicrobiales bacterium]|nr:AAA family ATPase [Thermomicrobiales bacterium]